MKAVRYYEVGEPEEVVRVDEVPVPAPLRGEVLVQLTARPVSPSVLMALSGKYGVHPQLPAIPGAEGAGVVAAVSEGCRRFRAGDRVTLIPAALGTAGTWCEFAAVPEEKLLPTPAEFTDAQAASAWANYLTAWLMATRVIPLRPKEVVIATALGSHIGRALLEMARVLGFVVVGTVRAKALVPELEALGAAAVATSKEELRALVDERTGGGGARAVFDAVGGATGISALRCLGEGGEFLAYGALSDQPVEVANAALIFRGQRVSGFWLTRWLGAASQEELTSIIEELMPHFRSRAFRPAIDREFRLEDVREALRYAKRSGRHGKVVLAGP